MRFDAPIRAFLVIFGRLVGRSFAWGLALGAWRNFGDEAVVNFAGLIVGGLANVSYTETSIRFLTHPLLIWYLVSCSFWVFFLTLLGVVAGHGSTAGLLALTERFQDETNYL